MATGALPRGFAPHHLGPPPRRPQQYAAGGQPVPQQQQYQQQAQYSQKGAAVAPALMKRPAGAPVPSVVQRQTPGVYGMQQQQQYPQQKYQGGQYGQQQAYGMQGQSQYLSPITSNQWENSVDTSNDSIAPEGFQTPGSAGYGGDASVEVGRMSPGQVDMNDFPHYQQQAARGNAPQLLQSDSTPRSGQKPSFIEGHQEMPPIQRMSAPHAQRSAAPPMPGASDGAKNISYTPMFRSEIDDDTSLIRSEADKIAQRLLKTEQELERLKKQGDLIGESLRKQKALDLETPGRGMPAHQVQALPGHFNQIEAKPAPLTEQNQNKQDLFPKKGSVSPTVAAWVPPPGGKMSEVPPLSRAASPPLVQIEKQASAPVQRAAAPKAQRAAAPLPKMGYPRAPEATSKQHEAAASQQAAPPPQAAAQQAVVQQAATQQAAAAPQQPTAARETAAPQQQKKAPHLGYPMPPDPQKKAANMASIQNVPNHPALQNEHLAKSVVDADQAKALGLPPGTMWFDPSDPAQMQMIKDQMEGKPVQAPAESAKVEPKPKAPRTRKLIREEDVDEYRQVLHVPEDFDSTAQVIRCYKRLAPSAHPSVTGDAEAAQLKKLAESCQACLAELRSKSTAKVGELGTIGEEEEEETDEDHSPKKEAGKDAAPEGFLSVEEVDAIEFYDEIFFHKTKHAQLKVKMGVSLEDLVVGHSAGCHLICVHIHVDWT